MKNTFLFVFIFCFVQTVFTQETSEKQYQLNNPNAQKKRYNIELEYQFSNTSEGTMRLEILNDAFETIIKKFSAEIHYKDVRSKNKIQRYVEKHHTQMEGEIFGESISEKESGTFTGQTITFKRKNNVWFTPKFDSYDSIQQSSLETYLKELNKGKSDRLQDFNYPERMRVGEVMQLDHNSVANFFDVYNVKSVKGEFVLSEVIYEDEESIAIFNVDFEIKAMVDNDDIFIKFKGTIKRSISKFYDKEINLHGTVISDLKEEKMLIKLPCKLHMTRKLE